MKKGWVIVLIIAVVVVIIILIMNKSGGQKPAAPAPGTTAAAPVQPTPIPEGVKELQKLEEQAREASKARSERREDVPAPGR
jgi:cell division protein FtsN